MANIKVRDLTSITGVDLFNDSESFMRDLTDDELANQAGGITRAIARVTLELILSFLV
jgi:hypothetical protein